MFDKLEEREYYVGYWERGVSSVIRKRESLGKIELFIVWSGWLLCARRNENIAVSALKLYGFVLHTPPPHTHITHRVAWKLVFGNTYTLMHLIPDNGFFLMKNCEISSDSG